MTHHFQEGKSDDLQCSRMLIQRHEEMLFGQAATLKSFMERYDNDRKECTDRYRNDRDESRTWRNEVNVKLDGITIFLADLKPNYRRAMVVWGVFVLGLFSLVVKLIWEHVTHKVGP
jgi:hypothetical protein